MTRCYAYGPDCDGPIEEHHLIKRQRIRRVWQSLMAAKRRGGPKAWSVTKAIADPRNKVYACKRTHHVEESPVPIPAGFWDFVAEYHLESELPRWLQSCGAAATQTHVTGTVGVSHPMQSPREDLA